MTKPTIRVCTQRRLKSAWASAQSDQSSLCAPWVAKDPRFLHMDSKDSADLSLCWAHTHFVGFIMSRLTYTDSMKFSALLFVQKNLCREAYVQCKF